MTKHFPLSALPVAWSETAKGPKEGKKTALYRNYLDTELFDKIQHSKEVQLSSAYVEHEIYDNGFELML